jgi:isopenicillin N synthase-like dioxygenase
MGKNVPVWTMQTINYELLLSQDPGEIDKVVDACLQEGYFYLDLKGIDGRRMLADQQETLKLMKRFFDAPIEQKNEFGLISSHLGYAYPSPSSLRYDELCNLTGLSPTQLRARGQPHGCCGRH